MNLFIILSLVYSESFFKRKNAQTKMMLDTTTGELSKPEKNFAIVESYSDKTVNNTQSIAGKATLIMHTVTFRMLR